MEESVLVLLLCVLGVCCQERCPLLLAPAGVETTGCYVVVFKKDLTAPVFEMMESKLLNVSKNGRLYGSVRQVSQAVTVALNSSVLEMIRLSPEVEYIEEESMAYGVQIPWHLDRLDQQQRPLNQFYLPIGSGQGVDLYILDSGISYAHEEFENRAKYSGLDPIDFNQNENRRGEDCHGHGTHVASLAAGKTYGVAKGARLYSVRVLDCTNAGPWSAVLQGLNHVMEMVRERGRPAVVSQSFGGSYFRTVDEAMSRLHSEGIFSVTSAGNEQTDACQKTPASSTYTVTVGGTRNDDDIYSFTNYGQCVDILAPGQDITGADYLCSSCSKVLSGTSMAAPMVSGAAAILLAREPLLKPQALRGRLIASSIKNILNFERIPFTYRSLTSNRLLHVAGECGGQFRAPVVIRSPNYPISYPHNLQTEPCQWTVTAPRADRVQCSFTDFDTEEDYDVVSVCEGESCCDSSVAAEWSGSLSPPPSYTSSAASRTFLMTSDGIINRRGFSLSCSPLATAPVTTPLQTQPPPTTPPPTDSLVTTRTTPPLTLPPPTTPPLTPPPPTTPLPVTTSPLSTLTTPLIMPLTTDVTATPPSSVACNGSELRQSVPELVVNVLEEAGLVLQELVSHSLSEVLAGRVLGQLEEHPASSCQALVDAGLTASGYYWLRAGNGSSVRVYCDLSTEFAVLYSRGFMRAGYLDMREPSHSCPPPLRTIASTCEGGGQLCGRGQPSPGCSSVWYSTWDLPFRRVCGRVLGYQFSSTNAFFASEYDPTLSLDDAYLDGVSLTCGASPRQHIWSFAAGLAESAEGYSSCPCSSAGNMVASVPSFVQGNYFCASGNHGQPLRESSLYCQHLLWDGQGCGMNSTCCRQQNHSAWFCAELEQLTSSDLELRLCGNEDSSNEDTPLQIIELYIQ